MNICVGDQGFADLQDGGYHLSTVGSETTRDGEICPVEVLLNSETEPQKTGLNGIVSGYRSGNS